MPQPNIKIFIALSGILVIILVALVFFPGNNNKQNTEVGILPTPTSIDVVYEISPTLEPVAFTGVKDEDLTDEIVDLAQQKQSLRAETPFDTGLFNIEFDYETDKFIVVLADPKDENLAQFQEWRNVNFPSIPASEFTVK